MYRASLFIALLAAACGTPSSSEAASEDESSGAEGEELSESPDAESSTQTDATYTHCEPPPPADCADCGLTINLRRSTAWRASEYGFEILTEGNHIRCSVTLPCTSTEPVVCDSSPGAPRVTVETAGCGGPADQQRLVALHFPADACPEDVRIEAFRAGAGAGNQEITPHFENGRAEATLTVRR